jgi:TIR domain-containing protein/effector-associated domain 1 (EAD1)-containing protein
VSSTDRNSGPGSPADIRLSVQDRNRLLDVVATAASTEPIARRWLRRLDFPPQALRAWTPDMVAVDWWGHVFDEFDLGRGLTPYRDLIILMAEFYPANEVIRDLKDRYVEHRAVPYEAPRDPTVRYVFISYSRADTAYVMQLVDHLGQAGVAAWVDKEIEHGSQWPEAIRERVDHCSAFVPVMSPDAQKSRWVGLEILRAQNQRKPILPLLLAGEPFFHLADVQHEDVSGGRMPGEAFVVQLQRCLAQV